MSDAPPTSTAPEAVKKLDAWEERWQHQETLDHLGEIRSHAGDLHELAYGRTKPEVRKEADKHIERVDELVKGLEQQVEQQIVVHYKGGTP